MWKGIDTGVSWIVVMRHSHDLGGEGHLVTAGNFHEAIGITELERQHLFNFAARYHVGQMDVSQ